MTRSSPLPAELGPVADLAPVAGASSSQWVLLTEDGRLARFDADAPRAATAVAARVALPPEPPQERVLHGQVVRRRLHVSRDGRFAAVVSDFGRHGQVVDLDTGGVTLSLDGGFHHAYTVPFSFAFTEERGRTLAVHRTGWNRLDLSEALSGELLTARDPGRHRLDYFHGALSVSPRGTRIADDGWVWHPLGVPSVWNLRSWAGGRAGESEDGRTRKELAWRDYFWNAPQCWIDERRLAVTGLHGVGPRQDSPARGVRVFDAVWRRELIVLPEVEGALFAAGGLLYAASPRGLETWDPATGELLGSVEGFVPTHHHAGAGEFAVFDGTALHRRPLPVAG